MKKIALLMSMLWVFNAQAETEYWIDARTDSEYSSGHVEGAHNIPYDEIAEKIASVTSDKNAYIHLYCRSGNRSGKALKVLENMGYTNAHNDGGISDLQHPAKLAD
jgi:phage shock protein E